MPTAFKRVLIIAPDQPGLDSIREVKMIQEWHHTSTLYGYVTSQDIFNACQSTAFDIHHYSTDSSAEGVLLSDGELFTAEDIAQVVRLRETEGVIFNSCDAARLANYVVRHGARWSISAAIKIRDKEAWQMASVFYSSLRDGHVRDFVLAYTRADSDDGTYGLNVDPEWLQDLIATVQSLPVLPVTAANISRKEIIAWVSGALTISLCLTILLLYLAGAL